MDKRMFFDAVRDSLFQGRLTSKQVEGMDFLLDEILHRKMPVPWAAYGLATTFHETAQTMQPIREIGRGRGKRYGRAVSEHGGQVAYGRGYVQLTWASNYATADRELKMGGRLIRDYDLALKPSVAAAILFTGMEQGWFTGKKLADYLPSNKPGDYVSARMIVNGLDRAELIADYARRFEAALRAAGYAQQVTHAAPPEPQQQPETTDMMISWDKVSGLIRHVLTFGGGWLVASGAMDEPTMTSAVAAVMTLLGIVWSWMAKK